MPTVPLFGHEALRQRLRLIAQTSASPPPQAAVGVPTAPAARSTHGGSHVSDGPGASLPSAILLHGAPGIGKQRLALWLGQLLLCNGSDDGSPPPCLQCEQCRYSSALIHPDLHWYFPRPRLKNPDPPLDDVRLDYAAAIAQRVADNLLYPPASGSDGIFVATVRAIVKEAGMTPAIGRRKVFLIGNAERMVPQEGTDQAANAFLKLLEEPAANTTLILTTSEPAALLPTIRSRLISFRMNKLADSQLREFLHDPLVAARFDNTIRKLGGDEAAMRAFLRGGAPGALLASESARATFDAARSFLRAAGGKRRSEAIKASFALGATGARGGFTEFLDALSELVHQSMQTSTHEGNMERVSSAAAAIMELQNARQLASGNITPQLLGIRLLRALERAGV